MKKNEGVITLGGNPVTLLGEMVKVGDKAQDFTVMTKELKPMQIYNRTSESECSSAPRLLHQSLQ